MKSYLLLLAAALVTTTASAQTLKKVSIANLAQKAAPADMKEAVLAGHSNEVTTPLVRRAKGTAMNPTAFYKRPKGTLYLGLDARGYSYDGDLLVYPPYAEIPFVNASTDPSATSWYLGTTQLTSSNAGDLIDAHNNLTWQFGASTVSGDHLQMYYAPTLVNGTDSFALAEAVAPISGYISNGFTVGPTSDGFYYGGKGPSAYFGDMIAQGAEKQIAFYQPFDKPSGSFVLNEVSLFGWRNGGSITDAAKNMQVQIYNVVTTEDGEKALGDSLLATFTFVPDSVQFSGSWSTGRAGSTRALLTFYPVVDDGLGGKMIQPVDLTDEFAVAVTGFSGTNSGFFFSEAPEYMIQSQTSNSYTFDDSAAPNAHFLAKDTTTNETYDYQYRYYCYPMLQLHGYQNYAHFLESASTDEAGNVRFTEFTAPTAGGVATNDAGYGAQLYTSLPWQDADGNNNYTITVDYNGETPWLTGLTQNDDNTYSIDQVVSSTEFDQSKSFVSTSNWSDSGEQVIGFSAQALPSGKTGRHATIHVIANGYVSNEIIVRQGDDNTIADGINNVTEDNAKANVSARFNNRTYNLAGQQVDKSYKGIVIKNGQKTIQ